MLINQNAKIVDNIYTDWWSIGGCPATVSTCPSTSNVVSKSADEVLIVCGFFDVPLPGPARCCPVSPWITQHISHSTDLHHLCHVAQATDHLSLSSSVFCVPLSSDRQHLSYNVCLEVTGKIIRTVLCCIVY